MGTTNTSLLVHAIFSTKNREPFIASESQNHLWGYIGGIVRRRGCVLRAVGGVEDHVHLLLSLKADVSVAEIVRDVKANSSKWFRAACPANRFFAWQSGYGAFSVSPSRAASVSSYIKRQKEHHRKVSFQEEFLDFLMKHGVSYDERYLWK
jgi:putative transposase